MNKAIHYKPAGEAVYYLNRGNIFHEMKNYEFAHRDFDQAIKIEDKNPRYWHAKGLSYEAISNKKEVLDLAIAAFEHSLKIDSEYFGS